MNRRILSGLVVVFVFMAATALGSNTHTPTHPYTHTSQDEGAQFAQIVQKVSPSICTVKSVIRTESRARGQSDSVESRLTVQGVVVDPDGLIVVSNLPFSPTRFYELMGMGDMSGQGPKMTPVSFKVTFEREEKEYDAFLAATDSKLDIAFLKIEALGDRKLPAIDLSSASEAVIGQRVISVTRLGKGYDYAPFFQTARVNAEIAKPRRAWMLEGGVSGFGLPVFGTAGELIGILSTVPGASKEEGMDESMGMMMFMRMMTGGGMNAGGCFVIPGSVIKAAADQAKERAVIVAAERAKKKSQPEPAAAAAKKPATGSGSGSKKPAPKP